MLYSRCRFRCWSRAWCVRPRLFLRLALHAMESWMVLHCRFVWPSNLFTYGIRTMVMIDALCKLVCASVLCFKQRTLRRKTITRKLGFLLVASSEYSIA